MWLHGLYVKPLLQQYGIKLNQAVYYQAELSAFFSFGWQKCYIE